MKNHKWKYIFKLIIIGGSIIFLGFFFTGICVSFYDEHATIYPTEIGVKDTGVSTRMTRSWKFNQFCAGIKPCHVYATAPDDAARSVFVNFHTYMAISDAEVIF